MSQVKSNKSSYTVIALLCAVVCIAVIAAAVWLSTGGKQDSTGATETTVSTTPPSAEPTAPSEPIENMIEQNDNIADDIFND